MISLSMVVWFVAYVLVAAGVFAALDYLVQKCPWLSEPAKQVVRYILLVLFVFVGIGIVISMIPGNGPLFRA